MEELKIKSLKENQNDYDKNHDEYQPGLLLQIIYDRLNDKEIQIKRISTDEILNLIAKLNLDIDKEVTIGLLIDVKKESDVEYFFKDAYKYEEKEQEIKDHLRNYPIQNDKFYYQMLCVMIQKDGSYKLRMPVYNGNVLALRNPYYYEEYLRNYYGGIELYHGPIEKNLGQINHFQGLVKDYINFEGSQTPIANLIQIEDYIDSLGQLCSDEEIRSKAKKAALENYDKNSNVFVVVHDYAKNILKQKYSEFDKLEALEKENETLKKEVEELEKPLNFQNFKKQCLETYVEKYKNKYSDTKYAKILKLFDEKAQEHTIDEIKEFHKHDMENPRYRKENLINDDKELDEIVKYAYYLSLEKINDFSSFYEKRKKKDSDDSRKKLIEGKKQKIKENEDEINMINEKLNNDDHKKILDIMEDLIKKN